MPSTNAWAERDKRSVWHPFTPQTTSLPPLPIHHGKGSLLYDYDGNAYIDAISSWWVTLHGHGHPHIAQKIHEQALKLEQVIFAGFTHAPAIELAERLLAILPGKFSKIFYSDNGSTAVEVALKMALQYWQNLSEGETVRKKLIAFNGSYHGDTFGAMSVSDRSVFTKPFCDKLFEVVFIDLPNEENIQTLLSSIQDVAKETAAFIYEPLVQGAGGMAMYEPEHLDTLLSEMKKNGILCIADEVMTGFGRTGTLFASHQMANSPDIICMSKGLTGGTMALGATACTHTVYEAYLYDDKRKTFFHGHSFTANPIACAAALASLDLLLTSECKESISTLCDYASDICNGLEASKSKVKGKKFNEVTDIRQKGTIAAFELCVGEKGYLNEIANAITESALSKGLYLRPLGNTVYIMPPYCITQSELKTLKQTLFAILFE